MKWLEIIELRSYGNDNEQLESRLQNLIGQVRKRSEYPKIKIYVRQLIDSDMSIHLFHRSDEIGVGGSRLGLILVSALKSFGLVNHRIWVERHGG